MDFTALEPLYLPLHGRVRWRAVNQPESTVPVEDQHARCWNRPRTESHECEHARGARREVRARESASTVVKMGHVDLLLKPEVRRVALDRFIHSKVIHGEDQLIRRDAVYH
jgi:hypothetical protein